MSTRAPERPERETVRLFADAYSSNGGNAAAAYKASHATCQSDRAAEVGGSKALRKPEIQDALERRRQQSDAKAIMTRSQRQALWTKLAQDEKKPDATRLRASELLGKSQADFVEIRVAPIVTDPQMGEDELVTTIANVLSGIRRRLSGGETP